MRALKLAAQNPSTPEVVQFVLAEFGTEGSIAGSATTRAEGQGQDGQLVLKANTPWFYRVLWGKYVHVYIYISIYRYIYIYMYISVRIRGVRVVA